MKAEKLRRLPAMGRLLDHPRLNRACELYGRHAVRVQARREVAAERARLASGEAPNGAASDLDALAERVAGALDAELGGLRRVVNATGVFLHTNLGRAPLPQETLGELGSILGGYCDLEIDRESGRRGERNRHVAPLLRALCGAEDTLVANNNAAALILALATLAAGREVVISRGELVEIGGSFRIPEILRAAGARLREVGSTNRTRLADYRAALGPDTALLLKVFPSNFRLRGFVEDTPAAELVALGREAGIPVLVDEGSGLLRPDGRPGLAGHASFAELLRDGCDLVCGSGDKLLGGPQAGLLAGRRELVEACRRHPLYRALRPDRYTYAALGLLLRRHLAGLALPIDRLWDEEALAPRLARLRATLPALDEQRADAFLGGGSAPDVGLPGPVLSVADPAGAFHQRLRAGSAAADEAEGWPPIFGRVQAGRLWLDLRTVDPADDAALLRALRQVLGAP